MTFGFCCFILYDMKRSKHIHYPLYIYPLYIYIYVVNPLVCEQGTTSVLTQVKGRTGASSSLGPVTIDVYRRIATITTTTQLYY